MFGIKRKGREQSVRFFGSLRSRIAPFLGSIFEKTRYNARKRLFIRWGRKNPRTIVWSYACFAVVILGWNILGSVYSGNRETAHEDDFLKLKAMAASGEMFDGMANINRNRECIQSAVSEYAKLNMDIARRLDSLMNVENKTRKDTLELMELYYKIKPNSK